MPPRWYYPDTMKNKIITLLLALFVLVPQFAGAQPSAADDYDSGKGCYKELLREREKASEEGWRKCISFFEGYYANQPESAKALAALFSSAKLRQEHFELRGDRSDMEGAIKGFNELIRNYPESSLADDALYGIGCMRQDALGQTDRAMKAYSHVLEKYPNGDMAVHARARLEKIQPAKVDPGLDEPPIDFAKAAPRGAGDIEEGDVPAVVESAPFPEKSGGVADPFNRAILQRVVVKDEAGATRVDMVIDKDVEHSVEFTEMGPRTGSPPELEVVLLHTKPADDLARERLLESDYVDSYKVKRLILSSGIKLSFKLRPDAGYSVKRTPSGVSVRFGPQNVATAVPASQADRTKASAALKLAGFRIVIDPGHGGEEEGAIGPNGVMEKDITLEIARRLASELRSKLGAKVYLTRTADKTLTLEQRSAFAVRKKADLFISIHANASRDRGASGVETYFLNNASDDAAEKLAKRENRNAGKDLSEVEHIISTMLQNYDAAESMDLAQEVQGRLAKKLGRSHGSVRDRGVRSALFYVLVGAKCPAILVETAFISNPEEEKLLTDERYQRNVARAITDGVKKYLKLREKALVSL